MGQKQEVEGEGSHWALVFMSTRMDRGHLQGSTYLLLLITPFHFIHSGGVTLHSDESPCCFLMGWWIKSALQKGTLVPGAESPIPAELC